jgi:hypothetical protein
MNPEEVQRAHIELLTKENDRLSVDIRSLESMNERFLAAGMTVIGAGFAYGIDKREMLIFYVLPQECDAHQSRDYGPGHKASWRLNARSRRFVPVIPRDAFTGRNTSSLKIHTIEEERPCLHAVTASPGRFHESRPSPPPLGCAIP